MQTELENRWNRMATALSLLSRDAQSQINWLAKELSPVVSIDEIGFEYEMAWVPLRLLLAEHDEPDLVNQFELIDELLDSPSLEWTKRGLFTSPEWENIRKVASETLIYVKEFEDSASRCDS